MRETWIGDLKVSAIGLGCNNFGRALDEGQTALVVDAALDAGITYFDTASNYGSGRSERLLGSTLGSRRDQVVISTKFGVAVPGWEESGGASPGYARKALERSLSELGTDYIDIWMIHRPDPDTPISDTLAVMQEAVEAGKIRQVGCSNFDSAQLAGALETSRATGFPSFVCDQVQYSLVHREPDENGLRELCAESGVALLPYYPLASGLLTGKTRRGETPRGRLRMDRYQRFLSEENFDIAEAVEAFARQRGLSMVEVALGWLLSREGVPCVTPGATRAEQVWANARAAEWEPGGDDLAELEGLAGG